jgi:hypothetical protein
MTKNIFIVKTLCRSIFMMAGLFVFLACTSNVNATCSGTVSKNGVTYGMVTAEDGNCWLDRNLGATRVATAYNDSVAYGWYFQWGRGVDGHQIKTSSTTSTVSSSDTPGHNKFITPTSATANDWCWPQNNNLWQGASGINNPCPTGYRLPTSLEWTNLKNTAGITNYTTAYNSSLRLTANGMRHLTSAAIQNAGSSGYYRSSTISGTGAKDFVTGASYVFPSNTAARGFGMAVRCIMDNPILSPTPTTQTPTNITTTTAQGNGNITNTGGENPTRHIQWGTTSGSYTHSCTAGTGSTGSYSCNLTNLTPNTTYYVRAYATNSAGTAYGSQTSFTTQAASPTVTTGSASNIDQWNVTLSGTITDIGADNPERMIQLTQTSGNYTSPEECTAGTAGTGTYQCTFTNLNPNTTYYYRAKATNTAGTSYGQQQSFTTPELQDTTITASDPTKITNATNDGYFTLNTGTITNTDSVTAQVNITLTNNGKEVTFPQNTTIQETNTNPFNFQNFTLESQNIKNEQPESRSAFRLGIEGTNLTFSQNITITTFIGEAFNNQTLDILYQNEGETTWNTHGTCTVENGLCTFQTNHATIYTINGTLQSTGDAPLNINTEVLDTLTMDCYESTNGSGTYDVLLGTVSNPGYVTAGTPAIGQSTCTVTTNDDQGYYLTVEDDNGISSTVLTHTDPNTGAIYEIQDLTHWNDTTLTTENWNPPTTKGLGFSVITFPDTDTANNIFDGIWTETGNCPEGINPDSNDYAGIPDTPQTIAAVPQYTANHTTTNICYKVDVPTSQPSGTYTGSVTYTATSDASSYLN